MLCGAGLIMPGRLCCVFLTASELLRAGRVANEGPVRGNEVQSAGYRMTSSMLLHWFSGKPEKPSSLIKQMDWIKRPIFARSAENRYTSKLWHLWSSTAFFPPYCRQHLDSAQLFKFPVSLISQQSPVLALSMPPALLCDHFDCETLSHLAVSLSNCTSCLHPAPSLCTWNVNMGKVWLHALRRCLAFRKQLIVLSD